MDKFIAATLAIVIGFGFGTMLHHIWTLGDNESDYSIVCLGGHQYWRANFATKGFLGIRLDDTGKPVACE